MINFTSKYLSEIESGKGLVGGAGVAAKSSVKDIKKTFSKENIIRTFFGGDDIFSTMIRSKVGVKKKPSKEKPTTPTKELSGEMPESGFSNEAFTLLKIIASNSMTFSGMARDMNVLRQNLQKLVKLKGVEVSTKADAFFLKQSEREAAVESQRNKEKDKTITVDGGSKEKPKNILDSIVQMFSGGFMSGIKSLFSAATLKKIIMKVFLPLAIIGTIFNGITSGFKKYQETGSFSDAIVSGLGGMLSFVSFGLFGEDTLKNLFENLSSFFKPITETLSNIFTGIKNFIKKIFGGSIEVEDVASEKVIEVKPEMPDTTKFSTETQKLPEIENLKSSDIDNMINVVKGGDFNKMIIKAQEFAKKHPETNISETTPTPLTKEGIPLDQAQRNFELNKSVTGEASKILGTPLEMPEPPTPASPPAPTQLAPTPAPEMANADKIKQLESYIDGNKKRFANREASAARHIESFKKRHPNDPERVRELEDDYRQTLDVERKEMENTNVEFQKQIDVLKKSPESNIKETAPSSPSTPSMTPASPTMSASNVSAQSPGPISAEPPSSGSSLSDASTQIAEAQRMESAADIGSFINAPVNNNSMNTAGKETNKIASVYDEEFAKLLATT
jgi:hypothetical protein